MDNMAARIYEMVGELHSRGYESLYLYSGMAPSGLYWRFTIGIIREGKWPNDKIITRGSLTAKEEVEWATESLDYKDLANKFESFYNEQLVEAKNPNPKYVNWYKSIRNHISKSKVLVFFADYEAPHRYLLENAPGYQIDNFC